MSTYREKPTTIISFTLHSLGLGINLHIRIAHCSSRAEPQSFKCYLADFVNHFENCVLSTTTATVMDETTNTARQGLISGVSLPFSEPKEGVSKSPLYFDHDKRNKLRT